MMKVGITGGIGSGKSTVCRLFARLGVAVYDSDAGAKRLMTEDAELRRRITDRFGADAYADGTLNRAYLAGRVFSEAQALADLNAIVHPAVRADFAAWARRQEGGYVADTPGFSTMDIERYELFRKEELPEGFREFAPYLGECKFTSCSHTCEKGCAVLKAVEEGKISRSRIDSYIAMYNEVKDIKEWQLSKTKNV